MDGNNQVRYACGKPAAQGGGTPNCDKQSTTFSAGGNHYVVIISNSGGLPCTSVPYTGCWQCWPSACYRCLGLYSRGETWGPYACGECKDRLGILGPELLEAMATGDEQPNGTHHDCMAGAGIIINGGMPPTEASGAVSSTDNEVESIYSGNIDSPLTQHDSVYSRSLASNSPSFDWINGRVSTDGRSSSRSFKPLPSLIPLSSSLQTCMGDTAPAMDFITQDMESDELLKAMAINDYLEGGTGGPGNPGSDQLQHLGASTGETEVNLQMDEGAGHRGRGEKDKESTETHTKSEALDITAGGTSMGNLSGHGNKIPDIEQSADSASSLGLPRETTASYLSGTPTKDKPPSVISLDESDAEKRSWASERDDLPKTPTSSNIRRSNVRHSTPKKRRAKLRGEHKRRTEAARDSSSSDGGHGADRKGHRGHDHGYARQAPRMYASNDRGYRQMRAGPTAAQVYMRAKKLEESFSKKMDEDERQSKERLRAAQKALKALRGEGEYDSTQSNSSHGSGRSKSGRKGE